MYGLEYILSGAACYRLNDDPMMTVADGHYFGYIYDENKKSFYFYDGIGPEFF